MAAIAFEEGAGLHRKGLVQDIALLDDESRDGTWQAILDPSLEAMRAITLADLVRSDRPRRHPR